MADIITRLLLKTNDFDANLNKAKGSVNQFQGGIANMAKTAGTGVMKFAGTLGVAIGATEGFMKSVNSTQTTGDAFTKRMDEAKASVDSFFASLAMGNVDGFLSNLGNVIDKAGDLSVILDELATKSLFSNAELNKLMTEKRIQENIAKDRSKSDEERNRALEEARELQLKINKLQTGLAETNRESAYAVLNSAIAKQGFQGNVAPQTWDSVLKESSRERITAAANEYRNKQAQIDNAKVMNPTLGRRIDTPESTRLKAQLNEWRKTSKGMYAEFAYFFTEMNDDVDSDIAKAMELIKKADSMKGAISDAELILNNTDAKINGSYKSNNGAGSNKPAPPPVGSLAALDAEITKQNKKLAEATTMQARAAVQATINELEQQKINLKVVVDQEAFKIKYGEMKGNKADDAGYSEQYTMFSNMLAERESALLKATDEQTKTFIQSQIDKLRETIKGLNKARYELETPGSIYEALQNNAGNKKQGSFDLRKELPNMKLPKFKSPIKKADINLNEEYAASLNSIGSIMGSLSGTFDGGAASVLQWGASIFSTIAQVIPLLNALTEANEIETKSEVKGAVGKTMNAHAKIPFVGIAMGLAGVASIFSVMSQAGKFATGGIVPGNSFTGDKVPAWVNSGEMILNSEQQSNLFKMLNSKLYGGLNIGRPNIEPQMGNIAALIAPDENGRDIRVSGDVKVKGSDLYLSLDNYKKKTGKK